MRTIPVFCFIAALLAQPYGRASAQRLPTVAYEEYRLANGLRVILAPTPRSSVVAVDLTYDVGSRNEEKGRTGFAHLFEHMLFEGSASLSRGEVYKILEGAGSIGFNASTTEDRTNYFQPLPADRLDLGLWLTADRMRGPRIDSASFAREREIVKEERRLKVDNQAYASISADELFTAVSADRCWAYGHSIIGSMTDLDSAKVDDVRAFFRQYYGPERGTLVVAGGFEPANAKALVARYFADIPRGTGGSAPPPRCAAGFADGARRRHVMDAKAPLPAVARVYTIPAYDHADYAPLELLVTVLGKGETSRINRALVRQQKIAAGALMGLNIYGPRRGPGTLLMLGIGAAGVHPDSLDKALATQIALVADEGVTSQELARAKAKYRMSAIADRERALGTAQALQRAAMFLGSPAALDREVERVFAVTASDIRRVARTYLRPDNALTLTISNANTKVTQ
jgi:predicted Zn-dependent peptidase